MARAPTQTIVGPQRDMRFGQQVEFIDIDGDSQVEMVVSAVAVVLGIFTALAPTIFQVGAARRRDRGIRHVES